MTGRRKKSDYGYSLSVPINQVDELCATLPRRPPPEILRPEHYLEVGLSADEREIIIQLPDPPGADTGSHWITFSPLQARHLARLLMRKAGECKA